MIRGEAAELARLKVAHPLWSLPPVEWGEGWLVQRGVGPPISASSLSYLEQRLRENRQPGEPAAGTESGRPEQPQFPSQERNRAT